MNHEHQPQYLELLASNLMGWLGEKGGALSEYELLGIIKAEIPQFFQLEPPLDTLYQKHFWLFHHLYRLQHRLSEQKLHLSVNALSIQVAPLNIQSDHLAQTDPLKAFYLDINNLYLSQDEVHKMQEKFWQRYLAIDKKAQAIKTLGLTGCPELTQEVIKRRYKQLVHKSHPDKQGDAAQFDAIKQAYNTLLSLF
ncbi:hypothetical protein DRW07_01945 [Alteromonas sediminis]|uniref:J domain-containing protein n=1 Tax=Alteromonas sediminis TaxID=2259342 RepID=A0A3N5YEK1_9ALTE|nr:DNA-J related domain-containing protein [Alteromonas sediminis]RPJ68195.1 hypothetical protein DRW07_01945 [Alteromonas sediminis]